MEKLRGRTYWLRVSETLQNLLKRLRFDELKAPDAPLLQMGQRSHAPN